MTSPALLKPRDRLLALATLWSEASGRSLGALSSMVMNHGGALERLNDPAKSVTDATLERFAEWFLRPANWPAEDVPEEAFAFAHVVGVSADHAAPSAGKTCEGSSGVAA